MKKRKKDNTLWDGRDMPLDRKSNEDFNDQHPDHDDKGLIQGNASQDQMNKVGDNKGSSDMKIKETKTEKGGFAKTHTCPMHPEVISDKPGKCPKCGMELIEK